MILDTVYLVTAVFIFMIGQTIRQDGNRRKILKDQRGRDGKESIIQQLRKMNSSKTYSNLKLTRIVNTVDNSLRHRFKLNVNTYFA